MIADAQAYCSIVRPKGASKNLMSLCSELADAILQKTGVEVESVADTKQFSNGVTEILIGDTSRPESAQAKARLGRFECSVSVINKKSGSCLV